MTENEFLKFKGLKSYDNFEGILIEFAKVKCQEQLEAILKNIKVNEEYQYDEYDNCILIAKVDKNSINNAYNLEENIK